MKSLKIILKVFKLGQLTEDEAATIITDLFNRPSSISTCSSILPWSSNNIDLNKVYCSNDNK